MSVEDIEFRVGLFGRIAIAFVQLGLAEAGSVAALGCLNDRSCRACDQRQADEQTIENANAGRVLLFGGKVHLILSADFGDKTRTAMR